MSIKSMCLYRSPNANYVKGSSGLGVDKENAISPKKLHSGKDKIYIIDFYYMIRVMNSKKKIDL